MASLIVCEVVVCNCLVVYISRDFSLLFSDESDAPLELVSQITLLISDFDDDTRMLEMFFLKPGDWMPVTSGHFILKPGGRTLLLAHVWRIFFCGFLASNLA